MKNITKLSLSLLTALSFLGACVSENVISTLSPTTEIQSNSSKSYEIDYSKQMQLMFEQYPESRKVFSEWKPETIEGFNLKQKVAKELISSQNKGFSNTELKNILSEKPVVTTESFKPVNFNTDQGEHKSKFTEWWYYNGHLKSTAGKNYGFELCFFRATPVIYFAHVAVTDENNNKFYYVRKFYSPLKVKTNKTNNTLTYENNGVEQTGDFSYRIFGEVEQFKFNLNINLEKTPLLINGNGLIQMPEGGNSYYYSLTKLKASGTLTENGVSTQVSGQTWMDHQWGNFYHLRVGWDWFSFQMEDNTEYNLFSFRNGKDQTLDQFVNVLDNNNKGSNSRSMTINRLDWWRSPNTSDLYVKKWQVNLPERNESFLIEATVSGQEVFPVKPYDIAPSYWEGSCKITKKTPDGKEIPGLGYIEHFAYKNMVP